MNKLKRLINTNLLSNRYKKYILTNKENTRGGGGLIEIDYNATVLTKDELAILHTIVNPSDITIISNTIYLTAFTINKTDTYTKVIFQRPTGQGIQVSTWTIDLQGNITKQNKNLLYG